MAEDFGIVQPVAPNVFRWPYAHMEVGDVFFVDPMDKPIGAVRGYAQKEGQRLGCKFSVSMVDDLIKVERFPKEVDLRSMPRLEQEAQFTDKLDDPNHLGVLAPPATGQWRWPFRQMEPGQYFHVSHADRNPEAVRAFAMTRASYFGLPLSVQANATDIPGCARIEYLVGGQPHSAKSQTEFKDLEKAGDFFARHGVNLSHHDDHWSHFWPRAYEDKVEWKPKPPAKRYAILLSFQTVGIEIEDGAIRIARLPPGTRAADDWDEAVRREKGEHTQQAAPAGQQRDPVDNVLATLVGSDEDKVAAQADVLMRD